MKRLHTVPELHLHQQNRQEQNIKHHRNRQEYMTAPRKQADKGNTRKQYYNNPK
jgi:hypothetical protein